MVRIAVYGTLRKGMPMSDMLDRAVYLGDDWINGYDMYAVLYPWAVKGSGKIKVEVYDVDELVFREIDRVERAAGYECVDVETKYGVVKMWVWPGKPDMFWEKVECGDYVKWVRGKC